MIIIEEGHRFKLKTLDDISQRQLVFVKRVGEKYPGNEGFPYGGTTMQEVLRAVISRLKYVNKQRPAPENDRALICLRETLLCLEVRAARVGGYKLNLNIADIEFEPTCDKHLHIQCGKCKKENQNDT